jgi:hypothetical protein
MANVRSIVTLNHGEINELNLVAQQAQRLHIPPNDYDRAMIILTPDQTQQQHDFDRRPLLLAAATVNQLHSESQEHVMEHVEHEVNRQHTHLITPLAEHMAKVEQDIPIFENLSNVNLPALRRDKLHEIPHESGIVSSHYLQADEQPMILHASQINRLDNASNAHIEYLPENDYYHRRVRAMDLLRNVEVDPNVINQPVEQQQINIFEDLARVPPLTMPRDHTRMIVSQLSTIRSTLEHTDEPVIYEAIDYDTIEHVPRATHLYGRDVTDDRALTEHAQWNPPILQQTATHRSQQYQLDNMPIEYTAMLITNSDSSPVQLQSRQEQIQPLEQPKQAQTSMIYGYGK